MVWKLESGHYWAVRNWWRLIKFWYGRLNFSGIDKTGPCSPKNANYNHSECKNYPPTVFRLSWKIMKMLLMLFCLLGHNSYEHIPWSFLGHVSLIEKILCYKLWVGWYILSIFHAWHLIILIQWWNMKQIEIYKKFIQGKYEYCGPLLFSFHFLMLFSSILLMILVITRL